MFIGIVEDLSTKPVTWYAVTEETDLSGFGLDAKQSKPVHDYFHLRVPEDFPPQEVIGIGSARGVRFRVVDATIARDVLGLLSIQGDSRPVRVCETYRLHMREPDMTLIVPPELLGRAVGLLVDAKNRLLGLDGSLSTEERSILETIGRWTHMYGAAPSSTCAGIDSEIYLIRQLTDYPKRD